MTFTSPLYFLYLPLVYLIFHFTSDRFRWVILLLASYGFYAAFKAPQLLVVLAFVTGVSYCGGILLGKIEDETKRKQIFWFGTALCILILVTIKYLLPLSESFSSDMIRSKWLVSIGVSYFIFQAISYLADVYLEIQEPEMHFGYYAVSLAFFPKLLQGPIERACDLLPQLKQEYKFNYDRIRSGIFLFAWGLFKKAVVADRIAVNVNAVFDNVHSYTGLSLIFATYAYAFQIFFDFAGYTDMARGTARIFGINLTENFNSPYSAVSIADFWRRWHISFSRWILDYIFRPLQLTWRNHGKAGVASALVITFFISGVWHGASWGFVVWGLLHGIYLASSTYYRPYQKKLHKWLGVEKSQILKWWQVFATFNLVSFAWIFFRMRNLDDARYVVTNVLYLHRDYLMFCRTDLKQFLTANVFIGQGLSASIFTIVLMTMPYIFDSKEGADVFNKPIFVRWLLYLSLTFTIILCAQTSSQFIYFKF